MLRAVPKSWFSSDYTLIENNTAVATIDTSWWREAGELIIKGAIYRVAREGLLSGAFVLASGSSVLARAEKPSALYRSVVVEYGGMTYVLEAASALRRKFVLLEEGRHVGAVEPEHALTRKAMVNFPEEIPLVVQVFLYWFVMILWKRDSDAAAAG